VAYFLEHPVYSVFINRVRSYSIVIGEQLIKWSLKNCRSHHIFVLRLRNTKNALTFNVTLFELLHMQLHVFWNTAAAACNVHPVVRDAICCYSAAAVTFNSRARV